MIDSLKATLNLIDYIEAEERRSRIQIVQPMPESDPPKAG